MPTNQAWLLRAPNVFVWCSPKALEPSLVALGYQQAGAELAEDFEHVRQQTAVRLHRPRRITRYALEPGLVALGSQGVGVVLAKGFDQIGQQGAVRLHRSRRVTRTPLEPGLVASGRQGSWVVLAQALDYCSTHLGEV